jgi:hypothetical protein
MKYIYEVGNTLLGSRICEIDSDNKVCFWSFSELKNEKQKLFKTDKQLKSFTRTKKWVLKHYPEMLL